MRKKLRLFFISMLLSGCAAADIVSRPQTPKLPMGMTEQEVFEKFGKPDQRNSVTSANGRIYESFVYKNGQSFTNIYFLDGKVYYVTTTPAAREK
ncbi:MAG: hypothetical protein PHN57_04620 [Candidatus Omnitrophica bacterium]|nr:hypothetical protein [Candidatus Omnitrophota bacterium]